SLQSRVAVEHELKERALAEVAVRGGLPQRQWYALHSATVPPRPAVEQFLEFANGPAGRRAFEKRGASWAPSTPSRGTRSPRRSWRRTSPTSASRSRP